MHFSPLEKKAGGNVEVGRGEGGAFADGFTLTLTRRRVPMKGPRGDKGLVPYPYAQATLGHAQAHYELALLEICHSSRAR